MTTETDHCVGEAPHPIDCDGDPVDRDRRVLVGMATFIGILRRQPQGRSKPRPQLYLHGDFVESTAAAHSRPTLVHRGAIGITSIHAACIVVAAESRYPARHHRDVVMFF